MERQRNHRLDLGQIHLDGRVVISALLHGKLTVGLGSSVGCQRAFHRLVRLPDGGQAAGLRGHHIDAVAVVHGQTAHAIAEEFHNAVFDRALLKRRADDGKGHILRADTGSGSAGQIDGDHAGIGDVIGLAEKLLDQFRAALADSHGAVSAVAGMGVGAEDHPSAAGVHLAHIAVDDGLVGGNELTAVPFGRRKAENMVVLVDGAADGAQGVVAVGQHIGQRKSFQPGSPRRLDDAHVGDVVGSHGVEFQPQHIHIPGGIMGGQNAVGDGLFASLCHAVGALSCRDQRSAAIENALVMYLYHKNTSVFPAAVLAAMVQFCRHYYTAPAAKCQNFITVMIAAAGKL